MTNPAENAVSETRRDLYTDRVGWALSYAARLHSQQTRKGKNEPYLSHVLQVAALVVGYGGSEDQIIAGALHDVAEDCGGLPRLKEIGRLFGPTVERIVLDCSDSLTEDPEAKAPWRERKISHLVHMRDELDDLAPLVAVCDKIGNLTDLVRDFEEHGEATLDRFNGKAAGTRAYYAAMHTILSPRVPPAANKDFGELLSRLKADQIGDGRDPIEVFQMETAHLTQEGSGSE